MSKGVLSDAEAKLLIQKLNRRMSAIAILTPGPWRIPWSVALLEFLITVLVGVPWVYWEEASDRHVRFLLSMVTLLIMAALLGVIEIYNANLNKRIDALVELLQQEGMLHPELRPKSAEKP